MLSIDHFATFFGEVHQRDPFPWQSALLRRVVQSGWPAGIDVPTGLGKTSVLDVAVFAAALGVPHARRRIFYVVDRRLIVDEAYEHARRIASALEKPVGEVTMKVAQRLRAEDDDVTLDVTRMRGGVTWERTWLERPDRHAIVTGTVDQVGSRLFFRGYGVSERARPIDAALVGTDSLIVIDEAHVAPAFVTTVRSAFELDDSALAPRPIVVTMSATNRASHAPESASAVHRISEEDERHPIAGERLTAAKRLHLVQVKSSKKNDDRVVPEAIAAMADRLAPGRVVGVVVNTVDRARAVFELLREKHEAVLLTGRSRPIDREWLLAKHYPHLSVDRDRSHQRPLIVVATQTIEVGANIDLDVLITESAPLAALVQRLGRLNRLGRSNHSPCPAIVVHSSATTNDDPVYGPARLATWNWLSATIAPVSFSSRFDPAQLSGGLDVSPAALRRLVEQISPDEQAALHMPIPHIPVLWRHHLDTWARTAPAPAPDQPIEQFLHGISDTRPPVGVVWRHLHGPPERWVELVDELPPVAEETLEVPAAAARRWLTGVDLDTTVSDLDTTREGSDAKEPDTPPTPRLEQVLRYRGRGEAEFITPAQIRPGDTIVVPTHIGGCDEFGWHPTSREAVLDVADLATRRGRPVVRLGPTLVTAARRWGDELAALAEELVAQAKADAETTLRPGVGPYRKRLETMRDAAPAGPLRSMLEALLNTALRVSLVPGERDDPPHRDAVAGNRLGVADHHVPDECDNLPHRGLVTCQRALLGDDDTAAGSSSAPQRVRLDAHQAAVAARARRFATALGLPTRVVESVAVAASWHDEGKRDPRFQILLWGGDRAAAEVAEHPLAKSGIDPTDRAALEHARRVSGYPTGMRHEALSALIATARLRHTDGLNVDPELVVHLVASHHGHGRPLLPLIVDPDPVKVTIDDLGTFDTAETIDRQQPRRFATLNDRYGRWGLALLETIVRLADMWCSARNETREELP